MGKGKGKETKRKKRDKRSYLKYITAGGVLATVTASLIVAFLQPKVEELQYYFNLLPTSATVAGTVQKSNEPLIGHIVRVDDRLEDETGDGGRFLVRGVPAGGPFFGVFNEKNSMLFCDQFSVPKGVSDYEIDEPIKVNANTSDKNKRSSCTSDVYKRDERQAPYLVDLMYAEKPSKTSTNRDVVVWIKSSPEIISSVDRVTYYLHNTFKPSVVTRYPEDRPEGTFALLLSAWGQFPIHAKVYFDDQQVKDMDANIVFH